MPIKYTNFETDEFVKRTAKLIDANCGDMCHPQDYLVGLFNFLDERISNEGDKRIDKKSLSFDSNNNITLEVDITYILQTGSNHRTYVKVTYEHSLLGFPGISPLHWIPGGNEPRTLYTSQIFVQGNLGYTKRKKNYLINQGKSSESLEEEMKGNDEIIENLANELLWHFNQWYLSLEGGKRMRRGEIDIF